MRVFGKFVLNFALPALNGLATSIHNAAALLFPAWLPATGSERRAGIEAMGQVYLVLIVMVLLLALLLVAAGCDRDNTPAASVAPRPTRTGAINCVSEPMNTSSSITTVMATTSPPSSAKPTPPGSSRDRPPSSSADPPPPHRRRPGPGR